MKHSARFLAAALIFAVLFTLFPAAVSAKDMEECYHCNKTGRFECPNCHNAGELTCDGCGGTGRWVCPGEEGKGKCDNGYYTCPSCNGDGLARPIPTDGNAGPCGQCGGSGKLECWHCHGAGGGDCDRCGGAGKVECQNENCKTAKTIGWKCPYCKGTGFLGDGPSFPPEWNDGVHNVPEVGDHIITDHTNWLGYYYGTGEVDPEPEVNPGRDPLTGRDYVWFIDVGSGRWEVNGQTVTVSRNGAPVSGTLDVKYNEMFAVNGIPDGNYHVYLTDGAGGKTELTALNGEHEYSVANRTQGSPLPPFEVSLVIEYIEGSAPSGPDGPDSPDGPDGPGDPDQKRTWFVSFADGSWSVGGFTVTAYYEGKAVSGVIELEENAAIKLEGFDREYLCVLVRGEDGFAAQLLPNGDNEFSLGRHLPDDCVIPDRVTFTVEQVVDEVGPEPGPDNPSFVPPDRENDFAIPAPPEAGEVLASASVAAGRMTEEERQRYASLSDEQLSEILDDVARIVSSARPGKADAETETLFARLAGENGFASPEEGKLFPIYFEGHRDLGFRVRVTVRLGRGDLSGGGDLYVYHRKEDGGIEALGKAEYRTYDDGSVETLSFYTTGFSSFFTAAKPLVGLPDATDPDGSAGAGEGSALPWIIAGAGVLLAAAAVFLILRGKRAKSE